MKRILHLTFPLLVLAGPAMTQSPSRDLRWPDIGVFGGYSGWDLWRSSFGSRPGSDLANGGVLGVRAGQSLTQRLGLEAAYTYGANNLRLFPDQTPRPGFPAPPVEFGLGARNHYLSLNPVWHFMGPESRLRPYVTAGLGAHWFRVTDDAKATARLPENFNRGLASLNHKFGAAFNWGGGVKYELTKLLELRLDARNIIAKNPHFMLPDNPVVPGGGVFIASGGAQSGLQLTGGIGFRLSEALWGGGGGGIAAPPSPGSGAATSLRGRPLRVQLTGDAFPLQAGATRPIKATTDAPANTEVRYTWTVNDQGMDTTGPDFNFLSRGREPGDYKVCATASAAGFANGSECTTVTVQPARAVRMAVGSNPAMIDPGQQSTVTASADVPSGTAVSYGWTVNGAPVQETGPVYTFSSVGRNPGAYEVCATASAAGMVDTRECNTVTIRECGKPQLSLAPPSAREAPMGQKVTMQATATPNSCGSPVQITFRSSDGAISADAPRGATTATGIFDSSTVAFDRANRSKLQRKDVTLTVTATDGMGNTASAQANVVVTLAPVAQRLDDVLFASRSSRVNNCGKRVLLEMLAPKLQEDPEAKVVLIGHIDETENGAAAARRRGKKGRKAAPAPRNLDKARVLNAAAVISGGQGICPSLELSRVKVGYAGKTQSSEVRPTFCGGSTEPRKGRITRADKRAPFRRVEVWIVPAGAALPPGVAIIDAPSGEVKALKCPK